MILNCCRCLLLLSVCLFIAGLIEGKSRFPALYLKYYSEDYRGVHAMTRVSKDEIVLEVPLSHIMTSEVAKASSIGQQLLASGVELNSTHSYLACYIIQERHNPNSFWKPYLDVLPQGYRNMPIFFTQEELAYLKGHSHAHTHTQQLLRARTLRPGAGRMANCRGAWQSS